MIVFLRDWTHWWLDLVSDMFSSFGSASGWRKRSFSASISADRTRLASPGPGSHAESISLIELETRLRECRRENRRLPAVVTLRLESNRALVRKISEIRLPASRLRAAALLDLETSTPFLPSDVHLLTLRMPRRGTACGSACAIVKRAILDPQIAAFKSAGFRITGIEIGDGSQSLLVERRDRDELLRKNGPAAKRRVYAAGSLCAVAALGTFLHASLRYDAAINKVEAELNRLGAEAKLVRADLDLRAARILEIRSLRRSVEERIPATAIWEELARILPDSAFLTDMSVKDKSVSIAGYSTDASSVIVALEGSDKFDGANFTAPVVKTPGMEGDRFAIDVKAGGW